MVYGLCSTEIIGLLGFCHMLAEKAFTGFLKCVFHSEKKHLWKNSNRVGKEKNILAAALSSLCKRIDRGKALITFLAIIKETKRNPNGEYFCFFKKSRGFEIIKDYFLCRSQLRAHNS